MAARDILQQLGYSQRTGNFKRALEKVVQLNLIEQTLPTKPNSRLQKYRLTPKGAAHLASRQSQR